MTQTRLMVYMYAQLYWTLPHKTMWKCFSEQYTIGNSHKKPLNVSISVSVWSSGHQLGICWTKHCFHDKLWCSKAALKKAPEDVCKFHHFDPPPLKAPTQPYKAFSTGVHLAHCQATPRFYLAAVEKNRLWEWPGYGAMCTWAQGETSTYSPR